MGGNGEINLNFGGKIGKVTLKNDQGIQKSAFGNDDNMKSIFGKYDKDKNNILDATELQALYKALQTQAGNDKKLSTYEATQFLKACDVDVKSKEAQALIKQFLETIGGAEDDVESAVKDASGNVTVTDKDGDIEYYAYNSKTGYAKLAGYVYTDTNSMIHAGKYTTPGDFNSGVETMTVKDYADGDLSVGGVEIEYLDTNNISQVRTVYADDGKTVASQIFLEADGDTFCTFDFSEASKVTIKHPNGNIYAECELDSNGKLVKMTKKGQDGAEDIVTEYDPATGQPVEKPETPADKFYEAFGTSNNLSVTIDGGSTGISKGDYEGKISVPDSCPEWTEGTFPQELRMTLPDSYGKNAVMKLKLVDPENGIYETTRGDRQFKIEVDNDGNVSVKSVQNAELTEKLNANLAADKKPPAPQFKVDDIDLSFLGELSEQEQTAVKESLATLAEVANMTEKPKVQTTERGNNKDYSQFVRLTDGRYIERLIHDDGSVDILIITTSDAIKADEIDLLFSKNIIKTNTDFSNEKYDNEVPMGENYDYDKICAMADAIFGPVPKEEEP